MSTKSVLKAGQALHAPGMRMLPRADTDVVATADRPGVWMSDHQIEALKSQCIEQGRLEGELEARRAAQQLAHIEAQKQARAWLAKALQEREEAQAKTDLERWRGLATALAEQTQALRARLEAEVTEWTFATVTRLCGPRSPADVAASVRRVLAESGLDGPLTVLLHPQDLESLRASGAVDTAAWPAGICFASDSRVGLTGCLVESAVQTLDARLEVQLAIVRQALDALRRERAGTVG